MRDRGPYPLSMYPGQSRLIQLLNPDETVFVIPGGATAIGRAINVLQHKVADLVVTVTDAAQGMIKVELPDTALVRESWQMRVLYDVQLLFSNSTKFLPISEIDIQYSPSQRNPAQLANSGYSLIPPVANNTSGGGGTTVGGQPTTTPPVSLYLQDQVWVDNTGKKVMVTIERQQNGAEYFKLTEIT